MLKIDIFMFQRNENVIKLFLQADINIIFYPLFAYTKIFAVENNVEMRKYHEIILRNEKLNLLIAKSKKN
jgi:hypothetical protein